MQDSLFPEDDEDQDAVESGTGDPVAAARSSATAATSMRRAKLQPDIRPAPPDAAQSELAASLPPRLRLGTSSWNYHGWNGLVWDGEYPDALLSKRGLPAYAQHPLFRAVSLDRAFYRPLTVVQYADYASQVPDDFRFVVKAPALVTDALVRDEHGSGMQANTAFLDPRLACQEFVEPALGGLAHRLGALVFQLSPLPRHLLTDMDGVLDKLDSLLGALPPLQPRAPDAVVAVEVRDALWIGEAHGPRFVQVLKRHGATFCLGLHAKMPPIEEQLRILRALWPGPLVCRWNLHRLHGRYGYEEAEKIYAPFDRMVDPDPETRHTLARVAAATARAGHNAYVTVSNKAEGCAPLTVRAFAEAITETAPPPEAAAAAASAEDASR